MNENTVKVRFEARPENQRFARSVVSGYLALADPTVEDLTEIKTAVSEAVSNCIIHAYKDCKEVENCFIDMKISMKQPDQCMITITDYGKGIENIDKAREPMFSTEAEKEMSGMGFTVMESFMDKVFVKSKQYEGTEVVLIKNLDICNVR